jgi:hypothetical protein
MSETERVEVLKAIQMELFELGKEYQRVLRDFYAKRKALKRKLKLALAAGRKTCRQCRIEMDIEQFYKDKQKSDGRDSYCIECRGTRNKISRCLGSAERKGNVIARGVAA